MCRKRSNKKKIPGKYISDHSTPLIYDCTHFNPFVPTVIILCSLKRSEKVRFSVFKGYRNVKSGINGLTLPVPIPEFTQENYRAKVFFINRTPGIFQWMLFLTVPAPRISKSWIKTKISKGFMKAFRAFIKPFEAPRKSVKIKI